MAINNSTSINYTDYSTIVPSTWLNFTDAATQGQYSVRWFGAKGDGIADDTSAIQTAIAFVLSLPTGGRLHFPTGTYLCSTSITIPKTTKTLRITGDGQGTIIRGGTSWVSGDLFVLGTGSSSAGGVDYIFEDFVISNPLSGTMQNGFNCTNMNICKWIRVGFVGAFATGVLLNSCFATRFYDCFANGLTTYFIASTTACHHLIIDGGNFFGVGGVTGQFLNIAAATTNIVIQNADFEECSSIYNIAASSSSILVQGNYIEYCANQEFYHQGTCRNIVVENNWISFQGTGGAGGGTSTYQNWEGGRFVNNSVFGMTVAFDNSTGDVDVGENFIGTGGAIGPCNFQAIGFGGIPFTNNWTAGALTPGYRKNNNGMVELQGVIVAGSGSIGNTAFTLFSGYRPLQTISLPCVQGDNTIGVVMINTAGLVVPLTANGGSVSLDGIKFYSHP